MEHKHMLFTEEQKERARTADIAELLRARGEKLKRSGSEYVWREGADKVTIRGNLWFHHYDRVGGDAIEFVKRYFNKSFPEAVSFLTGGSGVILQAAPVPKPEPAAIEMPAPHENMRQVYAYLIRRRGIDKGVLDAFVRKGLIYESAQYHNAVFVGLNPIGRAVHAHMRSTGADRAYKVNAANSMPEYSFHWNGSDGELYVFEAPIDLLSFICLHPENWRAHSYAAACSTSPRVLYQMLADNAKLERVYLCYDNDGPGQAAAERTREKLAERGIGCEILVPGRKDWNEDLLEKKNGEGGK